MSVPEAIRHGQMPPAWKHVGDAAIWTWVALGSAALGFLLAFLAAPFQEASPFVMIGLLLVPLLVVAVIADPIVAPLHRRGDASARRSRRRSRADQPAGVRGRRTRCRLPDRGAPARARPVAAALPARAHLAPSAARLDPRRALHGDRRRARAQTAGRAARRDPPRVHGARVLPRHAPRPDPPRGLDADGLDHGSDLALRETTSSRCRAEEAR